MRFLRRSTTPSGLPSIPPPVHKARIHLTVVGPGLNLQINPGDENNAYNIITTNDEHQVSLVDAIAQPDADFAAPSSAVQAEGGRVAVVLSLSSPVAATAEPVTISWSFAGGASFGTDATCFDSGGDEITPANIAAATEADCHSVVPADGSDTAQILITANADSVADDANLINLDLEIIAGGDGYTIGTAQPTHIVDITAPPDVSFAESGQSPADAGQSSVPHGGNEVQIQVDLSSPVPEDETLGGSMVI